jgi:hypothetical protein
MPGKTGWKHTEETKAKLKKSRAKYTTTFSAEARHKGQAAARLVNLGSTTNVKYKTPEERLYSTWTTGNFKKKGFTLTFEEASVLMHSNCHYCGAAPAQKIDSGKTKFWLGFSYQGIDRKDSNKGYCTINCVPCCAVCNQMKSDLSQDTFLSQVAKVAEFNKAGNKVAESVEKPTDL